MSLKRHIFSVQNKLGIELTFLLNKVWHLKHLIDSNEAPTSKAIIQLVT